jgi:AGCS family alanine or glycine:cation symporter
MAALFAVLITITFALSNNSVQSNTICSAMETAFGMNPTTVGVVLSIITLFVVFGGIQRVAKVSSIVVPIMAVGYLIISIVVVIMNINLVPHVLRVIVENAFGIGPVTGGGLGMTIIYGVKRGLFSNEAGEGSAPNAAATAAVTHPVKQGLIQALGVFTDTLLVCSCTAFIILISGLYEVEGLNGISLTQNALESEIGSSGPVFIAVAIFLFAYSSIIGNYYYGEANVRYLSNKRWVLTIFRILSGGVMVMFGAMATLETVWNIVDICMALLTACNLIAIVTLGKYAFRLLDDYIKQKREGNKSPEFHRSAMPDIADDLECWE